ncbi:transcriptional regulator LysR family [Cupriavidus necator N-1]|jgi:DNA-binding transcriptional LysR family regulator|uniref:Transcriptional regulator LysR family n=1 Tax=Cupriavidus necator (strain ATCC 43291 / DSM 13513 / CCUG 52238 / LMG 8453 / N-1) TaxID=1042878 RepID=G0ESX0_CUPNN|nr:MULTISPECIES: LysR substrate-binding domain-containing protein [Cupriavidus]AEI76767.1 transcriptional regulator LysR family [Cupriavidus necator N-1]EYS97902.1 LysR family transcriptional regulator [Cupriavidus sp. SK-4]KAI3602406.1 Transcriptional regulator, LysR family [Cupriavidus necator H850]MDX6014663.1 LysR substrate-binding domain-containing protein [Cupriavidus necator]QUN29702.1 LysR family transcriptional regulator [Cupriavidus sp. KK10]
MKMNLRQIEVFRAVMLTGSISGASKLLYVSQPAISRLMSHTEQRLGLELFRRTKGRLYPTPEARRLLGEVNAVYEGIERVNEIAEDLAANRTGSLRLTCSPNLGQTVLPRAIASFRAAHPAVRVVVRTQIPGNMLRALLSGQVDLAVSNMPLVHPNLEARLLVKNAIVALVPVDHRLATRSWVRPAELVGEDLIGYGPDVPFGLLVHEMFGSEGNQPDMRVQVEQAHVARALAQAGAGIALVDAMTVFGQSWPNIVAVPVRTKVNASVQIFHVQTEPLSRLSLEFVDTLTGMMKG